MKLFKIKRRKANRSVVGDITNFLLLALFGAFMALPMVYAIGNAFKPLDELFVYPPRFFVRSPTTENFQDLFLLMGESWVPFTRYMFNTLFITLCGTAGHVVLASMAAFVLEKHRFPGREGFFRIVVMALMFSPAVLSVPNYLIMANLRWIDTYLSLIVPAFALPLGLFLMKQFMVKIPDAVLESARIDGAGEIRIFFSMVMPSVKPGWMTLIILSFQSLWGATGGTFIYSEQLKTLPFALNQIMLGGFARAGIGAAVMLLMMAVPITMFIVTQNNVIQTMASSGIKE